MTAAAIIGVFLVLLLLSNVAVTYAQNRRAIENMRSVEAERTLRNLEVIADIAALPSTREDDHAV